MTWDLRRIAKEWLQKNGYDGLFDRSAECACFLDDLMPCGSFENAEYCKPGYKIPCDGTCDQGKCDGHITEQKPASAEGDKI